MRLAPKGSRAIRDPRIEKREGIRPGYIVGVMVIGTLVALAFSGLYRGGNPTTTMRWAPPSFLNQDAR
jgi:hypothetical protein